MNHSKLALGLMLVLGLGDLALVPLMIHAHSTTQGTPPPPGIGLGALLGIVTLAVCPGIRDGSARPVSLGSPPGSSMSCKGPSA